MPIDLDKLERLEREATPGPWELWEKHLYIFAGPAEENDPSYLKGARVTICDADFDDGEWEYQEAAERGHAVGTPEGDFNLIVAARNALPDLLTELRTLRARVAELEEDNEWLRGVVRTSCVRKPTPGCDCPGCETSRERSAQVDLVDSYEAELEEDRQAERDRILGARVREVMEANGTNPERFVSEWCRAQAEYETEEAAREWRSAQEGGSDDAA